MAVEAVGIRMPDIAFLSMILPVGQSLLYDSRVPGISNVGVMSVKKCISPVLIRVPPMPGKPAPDKDLRGFHRIRVSMHGTVLSSGKDPRLRQCPDCPAAVDHNTAQLPPCIHFVRRWFVR